MLHTVGNSRTSTCSRDTLLEKFLAAKFKNAWSCSVLLRCKPCQHHGVSLWQQYRGESKTTLDGDSTVR